MSYSTRFCLAVTLDDYCIVQLWFCSYKEWGNGGRFKLYFLKKFYFYVFYVLLCIFCKFLLIVMELMIWLDCSCWFDFIFVFHPLRGWKRKEGRKRVRILSILRRWSLFWSPLLSSDVSCFPLLSLGSPSNSLCCRRNEEKTALPLFQPPPSFFSSFASFKRTPSNLHIFYIFRQF